MDLFEKLQSRIRMMENPHHLNQFHLIGLVHFAAEAATELRNINCDGTHKLWTKFATTPLLKNLIKKHCRHQSTVCGSLLSLPHNPLSPVVLDLFVEEVGAFDLINILKNLLPEKLVSQSIIQIHNRIENISNSLSAMSQQQIALRVMEIYHDCPMADPVLTLKSLQTVKDLNVKLANNWEESFLASLKIKMARNLIEVPLQSLSAAQYYVQNLDDVFKEGLYSMCVDSLQWQMKNRPQEDCTSIINSLNALPCFNEWLLPTITATNNDAKNILVAHHQKSILNTVVGENKNKTVKKI